jgi:hypothetical protein
MYQTKRAAQAGAFSFVWTGASRLTELLRDWERGVLPTNHELEICVAREALRTRQVRERRLACVE